MQKKWMWKWSALWMMCLVLGCSGDEDNNDMPEPEEDLSMVDMAQSDQDAPDLSDQGEPEEMEEDMDESSPCEIQSDCAEDEICVEQECMTTLACSSVSSWIPCYSGLNEIKEGLGRRAWCDGSHCRLACLFDEHCADGELCTDNGQCRPFTGEVTGMHPGGGARAPIQVGVGNALMQFPLGLSLAGYGSRMSANDGRYVESLRATHGQMHGLYARAVLFDNGERQLLFIRLPTIFPSEPLHEAVARELQARTGADWRDSLIITSTHTHSGPGRFFHLPSDAPIKLGALGTDEFSQIAFDWMKDSIVEAAQQALDDRQDAKVGWEIVEAFDMNDRVASDRWGETPSFDDNRLLLIRIDDLNDVPRAVMMSFGTHGTFNESDYFTGDSIGGMERGLEKRIGEEYGVFAPVLFFNENGGSMSPRGDHRSHTEHQKFEHIGYRFVESMWDGYEAIATKRDLSLSATTHRFPITYEYVGYEPGEWQDTLGARLDYHYGGLQCMPDGDSDPLTYKQPDEVSCLGIHKLLHHRPATLFARSLMTAVDFDGLTLVTIPGEITMELGWQILRDVRDVHGIDPLDAFIFGYSQDHLFYLVPTDLRGEKPPFPGITVPMAPDMYPPYAFSFLQGGYEAGFSIWGYKFGDFLIERAVETVAKLQGTPMMMEYGEPLPTEFTYREDEPFPMDATPAERVGTITRDMPAQVERLTQVEFGWIGGDPGAEMPQAPRVVLEREQMDGSFAVVRVPSTREYDNREAMLPTRLRPTEQGEWEWIVYWEELKDFPAGTYRFHVDGHYLDSATDMRTPYQVDSASFALVPSSRLDLELETASGSITGRLAYPVAERLEYVRTPEDKGGIQGSYRMRHPEVPSGVEDPLLLQEDLLASGVTVTVSQSGTTVATYTDTEVSLTTETFSARGKDEIPATRYTVDASALAAGTYDVEVAVTDQHGNTGSTTGVLTVP